MVIVQEKEFHFVEMAKMPDRIEIPQSIGNRTRRLVVDEWWYDKNEENDLYKIGIRLILAANVKPFQGLTFDHGFIRAYKNTRQGKSTGADNNPRFEFHAIHLISNIPGAEGQWYRDDFRDADFENVIQYEDDINLNTLSASETNKLIQDFKLKPATGFKINILSILDRLLK
jgi:hypothetical protein